MMADKELQLLRTRPLRSVIFAPANRPDLVAKIARTSADAAIIDLEDGTPPAAKLESREIAVAAARSLRQAFDGSIWLRVNAPQSEWMTDDMGAAASGAFDGVMVPKIESAEEVARIQELASGTPGGCPLFLGFETVAGAHRVAEILQASSSVVAAYFGAEDYIADLGGRRSRSNAEVHVPRSNVAIACRLRGIQAIDQVVLDFRDSERFLTEAAAARDLGYHGKMCIHPAQVELAHEAFAPSSVEIDRAHRLLACYASALAQGQGTANFEGQMIDPPMITQAETVLELAERAARSGGASR